MVRASPCLSFLSSAVESLDDRVGAGKIGPFGFLSYVPCGKRPQGCLTICGAFPLMRSACFCAVLLSSNILLEPGKEECYDVAFFL